MSLRNNLFGSTQSFEQSCKRIESDKNFVTEIGDRELLNIVVNEFGESRYSPYKSQLKITPSSLVANSEGHLLGKLYQLKLATRVLRSEFETGWDIDEGRMMLVRWNGNITMHTKYDVQRQDFKTSPTWTTDIEDYLNQKSLPQPELKPRQTR